MISYVICTINRPIQATACVNSLLRQKGDFEVVVIDQSVKCSIYPADNRLKIIAKNIDGLSYARNLGYQYANGDIVAYVDDDALVADNHLDVLQTVFSNNNIDAVAGRILINKSSIPYAKTQTNKSKYLKANNWNVMLGGNIAFRRSTIESVGLFDDRLGAGRQWASGEETDYFLRMHYLKKKIYYCADLVVFHPTEKETQSFETLCGKLFYYGKGQGALFAKHYKEFNNKKVIFSLFWSLSKPCIRMIQFLIFGSYKNFSIHRAIMHGRYQGFKEFLFQSDTT